MSPSIRCRFCVFGAVPLIMVCCIAEVTASPRSRRNAASRSGVLAATSCVNSYRPVRRFGVRLANVKVAVTAAAAAVSSFACAGATPPLKSGHSLRPTGTESMRTPSASMTPGPNTGVEGLAAASADHRLPPLPSRRGPRARPTELQCRRPSPRSGLQAPRSVPPPVPPGQRPRSPV